MSLREGKTAFLRYEFGRVGTQSTKVSGSSLNSVGSNTSRREIELAAEEQDASAEVGEASEPASVEIGRAHV